ncbi:SET domain-containing protein 9-like [Pomacea canaliculata]|uniref:SET domain-containing protein 9-like n=1 Tax=Pomacea canaliculata TaxID=400727 RepID=UPI000D7277F4|nr:SET domain-containing protein 9-like [Pomacea canaliculata]
MGLRRLLEKWKQYRYRFVPWLAYNLKDRSVRSVPKGDKDKLVLDEEVKMALINFLSAIANSTKDSSISSLVCLQSSAENNLDLMHKVLGFKIQRQLSSIPNGGTGVIVTAGFIPAGTVTSLYPGLLYQPHEPIFFQSLGNPFIFRCIDGLLIDGNDKGISRLLYKSCHGRDRLGPFSLCDASWLTNWPINPLAVGQYVNNHNKDFPANVAYQEFDLPFNFPFHLRQYLPNNFYSANVGDAGQQQRLTRLVVLVATRDIHCGEELLSSYFTVVH